MYFTDGHIQNDLYGVKQEAVKPAVILIVILSIRGSLSDWSATPHALERTHFAAFIRQLQLASIGM